MTALTKVARHPGTALRVAWQLFKGWRCRAICAVLGRRFECGRNLRIEGRLIIRGPGRVVFGDNVRIGMTVTPWTVNENAVIQVGSGTFLNGTRFSCADEISIGEDCILANASVLDTDFHSTHVNRQHPDAPVRVAPVRLGRNVWIAAQAGVLPGTEIGENSVAGFGAVLSGKYPPDSIIAGNPAQVIRPVPGMDQGPAS